MKSKGFTLIELLAVIVILAIIALIAVPIILNIIDDSKKQSSLVSAKMYMDAVEKAVMRYNLTNKFPDTSCNILEGGNLDCEGLDDIFKVEMNNSNQIKAGGTITLNNGNITAIRRLNISGTLYELKNGEMVVMENSGSTDASCFVYATETVEDFDDYDVSKCKVAVAETLVELGAVPQDQIESEEAQSQVNSYCASKESVKGAIQLAGSVLIPKLLEQEALTGVKMKQLTETSISGYTCNDKDVIIPSTLGGIPVAEIGVGAFMQKGLTNVTIPNTVTTIGEYAFSSNQLTSVTIPNSVEAIGAQAFEWNQIKNLTIGNRLSTISYATFQHNQLTKVTIPNSVTRIEASAFRSNKLTEVTIPNSVTEIIDAAFKYNQLESITIGSGIKTIASNAFGCESDNDDGYGPNALTSVSIDKLENDSELTIQSDAFCWKDSENHEPIHWRTTN